MKTEISITAAFIINLVVIIMGLFAGLRYIFSTQLLGYHLDAMSISDFSAIDPDHIVMLLTFLRVAGLGMTTASISMAIVLFCSFRKGENWSRWGILMIFSIHFVPLQINMIHLANKTPASPPYLVNFTAIILILTAFTLSRGMSKKIKPQITAMEKSHN